MAGAGPVTSFFLAGFFGLAWLLVSVIGAGASTSFLTPILFYGALLNAMLGAFNLIPAFPSDGGRILRALLVRRKKDYNEATKTAANVGIGISYGFMAFGFVSLISGEFISAIWILLLGWFLRSGASSYLEQIRLTSILSKIRLRDIMNTNVISVRSDLPAEDLLRDYFNRYMRSAFPVVDERNRLLGLVTLARLIAVPEGNLAGTKAQDVMIDRSDLIVMDAGMTAEKALVQMTQKRLGKIFVCKEGTDELIGIVTKTDVLNVEMERQEIAEIIGKSGTRVTGTT
jgi:CBS domain-containing protein